MGAQPNPRKQIKIKIRKTVTISKKFGRYKINDIIPVRNYGCTVRSASL